MQTIHSTEPTRVFIERSPGVELSVLHHHSDGGLTFLIRMQKGARAERHGHPGGEETYLVSGALRIDRRIAASGDAQPDVVLRAGDYLYAPPNEIHEGFAEEACVFYVVAPGGVVRQEPR